ncbi:MAG: glycosyltransferase family 2 protein [Planctomycetota bacterium]
MTAKPLVSIIAPVYNEESVVGEFVKRIASAIKPLDDKYAFEIILVDDGSRDRSLEVCKKLAKEEPRLRVLELRRNYGQTPALQAGLDTARGEIFITMDSDLQHFPEEIPQFLEKLSQNYDIVCGWRHKRREGIIRRWPSRVANLLIRFICGLEIHDFGTTYRAYRAELARELRLFGEFHRYIPVLGRMLGGRITELPIENIERPKGKSNYGIERTFGVFLDLLLLYFFVKYMDRPMRAFGTLSALSFAAGAGILAVLLGYAFVANVATVREHSGWFLMSIMLLLASVQILLTGILAEILIRIHYAQGDRRVYNVRREWTAGNL